DLRDGRPGGRAVAPVDDGGVIAGLFGAARIGEGGDGAADAGRGFRGRERVAAAGGEVGIGDGRGARGRLRRQAVMGDGCDDVGRAFALTGDGVARVGVRTGDGEGAGGADQRIEGNRTRRSAAVAPVDDRRVLAGGQLGAGRIGEGGDGAADARRAFGG